MDKPVEDRHADLDRCLAHCPPPAEIGKGTCFGVPLSDMSRDQLLQVLWLFSRQSSSMVAI